MKFAARAHFVIRPLLVSVFIILDVAVALYVAPAAAALRAEYDE